jgi:CubicO group peptidase (beta-lactamase class C family)
MQLRSALAASSARLAFTATASAAPSAFLRAPSSWALRHGMSAAQYQDQIEALASLGYRPVAIDVSGSGADARFTATWTRDGRRWEARHGLSSSGFQSAVTDLWRQGMRVESVAVYGTYPYERYAAAWVQDGRTWQARHRMSRDAYQSEVTRMSSLGYRPAWVSASGRRGKERFAAVWLKDGKGFYAAHDRTRSGLDAKLRDYASKGYRLICVDRYGTDIAPRYVALWERAAARAGENMVFADQTSTNHNRLSGQLLRDGFRPLAAVQTGTSRAPRWSSCWAMEDDRSFRITGAAVPELAGLDDAVRGYMQDRRITCGQLAVLKDGRLVLSRGYTNAPRTMSSVQPWSRFRLASISKPITAIATLQLVDRRRLTLQSELGSLLSEVSDTSKLKDPRFAEVTIEQLLRHRGGWAISARRASDGTLIHPGLGFDPQFRDSAIARKLYGTTNAMPISTGDIIEYMAENYPLQFEPGTQRAYSNFGFNLLGRVVERRNGLGYEAVVRRDVLDRVGVSSFDIGSSRFSGRRSGEVIYLDTLNRLSTDVMGTGRPVPNQYGGWHVGNFDAHGGWISSAQDLARVGYAALEGGLLSPSSRDYYRDVLGYPNHNGSIPGSWVWLQRRGDVIYAVLFNQRAVSASSDPSGRYAWSRQGASIRSRLNAAIDNVTTWPAAASSR